MQLALAGVMGAAILGIIRWFPEAWLTVYTKHRDHVSAIYKCYWGRTAADAEPGVTGRQVTDRYRTFSLPVPRRSTASAPYLVAREESRER
jgi:hypothetical protein